MTVGGVRTSNYSSPDRKRLGDAVAAARRAAGFRFRPGFVAATGLGMRSLEAIERGEPTVGVGVLEDVGRALGRFHPAWDAATPKRILDGDAPPDLSMPVSAPEAALPTSHTPSRRPPRFSDEWLAYYASLLTNEEDFLEFKLVVLALDRLQRRVDELERIIAEGKLPQG